MADDKQDKITFTYSHKPEEMGYVPMPEQLPHWIYLFPSFISEKGLSVSRLFDGIGQLSNVTCPFCKNGVLRLAKIEPIYSGGANPHPSTLHHVGNKLEYDCSNTVCDATFSGNYRWMWID